MNTITPAQSLVTVVVPVLTPSALLDALAALEDLGVPSDGQITVNAASTTPGGVLLIAERVVPAPKAPRTRRCTAEDGGRRCVRGPRHHGNHRYAEAAAA